MSASDPAKDTVLNPNKTRITGERQHSEAIKTGNETTFSVSLFFINLLIKGNRVICHN